MILIHVLTKSNFSSIDALVPLLAIMTNSIFQATLKLSHSKFPIVLNQVANPPLRQPCAPPGCHWKLINLTLEKFSWNI